MEELFSYALLLQVGFDVEEEYKKTLDRLFLNAPEDSLLIELEYMSDKIQESADFIRAELETESFDRETFSKTLVAKIKECFCRTEIQRFAERMYLLWQILPESLRNEQPLLTLNYAGDSLQWGDEAQAREHFEQMFRDQVNNESMAYIAT